MKRRVRDDLYALVPKGYQENIAFRKKMIRYGASSEQNRLDLWTACARSPLFYINTMCYLFEPRKAKVLPFITYEYQDDFIQVLLDAIGWVHGSDDEQSDLIAPKTRDVGVSWKCCTILEWLWHFHDLQTFLMLSRKEDLVDKRGDPKELFFKVDFIHKYQPKWFVPTINRMKMLIENKDNGSVIGGESTNEFAGVADRKRVILLDEFSKMENQEKIYKGTQAVSDCRLFVFTPEGSHNKAYEIAHNPKFNVYKLHWNRHPSKGRGLYCVTDGQLKIIDTKWHDENPDYNFVKDGQFFKNGKYRSPWYDKQCERADHPMEISQELDIDFLGSDFQYFQDWEVEELISKNTRPPDFIGEVEFDEYSLEATGFVPHEKGRLLLWMPVDAQGNPLRDRDYTIGVDISEGTGATNSVMCIGDNKTNEQVGLFVSPRIRPEALADMAIALCNWLKGPSGRQAFLIWEAPGPGNNFRDRILDRGFRNFYYRKREDVIGSAPTKNMGWWPTKDTKRSLLGEYKRAMLSNEWVVRSREELEECKHYIYTENGWVIHSGAINSFDPSGARENHGDRPTASGLCWKVMHERKRQIKEVEPEILVDSLAWRREEAKKALLLEDAW